MIRSAMFEEKKDLGLLHPPTEHIRYGLGKNSMLVRIYPPTIRKWQNMK